MARERCFACGRVLGSAPNTATCADEQDVVVGASCYELVERAGSVGYQPPRGGPRLYTLRFDPKGSRPVPPRAPWR